MEQVKRWGGSGLVGCRNSAAVTGRKPNGFGAVVVAAVSPEKWDPCRATRGFSRENSEVVGRPSEPGCEI